MNVLRYELGQYRRGMVSWCAGMVAFVVIYASFLPAFLTEVESLRAFFAGVGQLLTKAMGFDVELFLGPLGFYGYLLTFLSLAGAVQAVHLGLSIISKESRMRAADFLLTKPARRGGIFAGKLGAAVLSLLITQAVFALAASLAMYVWGVGGVPVRPFALITASFGLVQWFFLAMGMLVAAVWQRMKTVITVAMGLSLGFFLVGMVANMAEDKALRLFAPMRYFDTAYIITNGAYETGFLLLCVGLTLAMGIAACAVYTRRDIRA